MDDVAELVELPGRATPDLPGDLPVDLDLGELAHRPTRLLDDRTTTPARRAAFLPPGPRRALVLLALVALLSAVVGWQVGAHRADARSSSTTAPPAVLSWLEDNGSNAHSTVQDPSEDLELHITNLGADPVRRPERVALAPR